MPAASSLIAAYGLIQNGHKIQIRDNSTPSSTWFFTATGPAVDNGTLWTIPVAYGEADLAEVRRQ